MGLKQDIVIVNEFTVKTSTGLGTRGSSPGNYVVQYMLRDAATETVSPIRKMSVDSSFIRYMLRGEATEKIQSTLPSVKREMKEGQGLGGIAFGYGQFSLSDEEVSLAANDIQTLFDEGKTVMKTVLSFDRDYLIKMGILSPDVDISTRGDYRGHIDQLKLRLAIMHGLSRMGSNFDDMRYVGVIQVDTLHVHAHLAIVDAGEGRRGRNPRFTHQTGIIGSAEKRKLRRGIDNYLDEVGVVKHFSSAVTYDRRNVVTYIKKWAHERMLQESMPQFLLACLPDNRSMWRANTNRKEMRKPNAIAREMVEEALSLPGSPLPDALLSIRNYANERFRRDNLSEKERQAIIANGRKQIIDRGVNSIYNLLQSLPQETLQVRTPMLDVMSLDYETVAHKAQTDPENDIISFSFRLRSYSQRLRYHRKKRKENHDLAEAWLVSQEKGVVDPASVALYEMYRSEADYHARVAAKYEYFLPFPDENMSVWQDEWENINVYADKLQSLISMRKDRSLMKMKDAREAERLGKEIYGQSGGRFMTMPDKSVLDDRIEKMRSTYWKMIDDLKVTLSGSGMVVAEEDDVDGVNKVAIVPGTEFDFKDVRSLDLHNMGFDFTHDVSMDDVCRRLFLEMAYRRHTLLEGARDYLVSSGQDEAIEVFPVKDIEQMRTLADELSKEPIPLLKSEVSKIKVKENVKRSKAIDLTEKLSREIVDEVDRTVREVTLTEYGDLDDQSLL